MTSIDEKVDILEKFPQIPKNTPIRIGGTMWEEGVQIRVRILMKAGYTNVIPDRTVSLSYDDFNKSK